MDNSTASGHLQRARAAIKQALEEWDPIDFLRVERSLALLASGVGEMRTFESAARRGEVTATDELYSLLLAVKQEIAAATRVVDACVAFHRGLAARMGDYLSGYDAEGRVAEEFPGLEPEVLA